MSFVLAGRGFIAEILPSVFPHSTGLLAVICRKESQSPRYSPGMVGPWLQMSHLVEKPTMWFPNKSDTNRPVEAQKRAIEA